MLDFVSDSDWPRAYAQRPAPPVLVQTELTKFAYVCSGVIRFECPNVKFDQYSERKHKNFYSLIEFQGTPMLLFCAWSILIGQAADGSTCLQNPILALTMNGRSASVLGSLYRTKFFPRFVSGVHWSCSYAYNKLCFLWQFCLYDNL